MKPKYWKRFLEQIAIDYNFRGRLKRIFLTRFAYNNWNKREKEIWELAQAPSHETFKKQMSQIYARFSASEPLGCPDLKPDDRGPGKFEILKQWLRETKYPQWQNPPTAASNSINYFDYEKPVPLNSPFYVDRPPIESDCFAAIAQPGALIRIKAPTKMGKTSLLDRIIEQADKKGDRTVRLNLLQVERAKFSNLDSFLRWFCSDVSDKLQLSERLDDYWNEDLGSMTSCTRYFEMLLNKAENPLVLGLDAIDRVFEYPQISQDFFYLLRSWHEDANNYEIWERLRLVVVHCTENYGRLDINQSPFNVGLPIALEEFTAEQVKDLAQRHRLDWDDTLVQQLMKMVGGHPFLIQLAFSYLVTHQDANIEELLQTAPTEEGIYSQHLRPFLVILREDFTLATAFSRVINKSEPVRLDPMLAYKLYSMGLVKWQGDRVIPRCQLYRQYFRERLGVENGGYQKIATNSLDWV